MSVFTERLHSDRGPVSPQGDTRGEHSSESGGDQHGSDQDGNGGLSTADDPAAAACERGSERTASECGDSAAANRSGKIADRGDPDIEEFARIQLQLSPYRAIRRVKCSFSAGVLTLSGHVPTYHYKQLAQTAVSGIVGVDRIDNTIAVG